MPVTAKLSKLFYDRLGDQVVSELVDWLNAVDAEYRSALRETNEMNFARFDAKQAQRFAEQDARIEKRFAEQDARLEKRFAEIDTKFAENREFMERALKEQTRWMFVAWASLLIPIIGLWTRP